MPAILALKKQTSLLVVSGILTAHMPFAVAGSCRPLEYAEIKDTPTKELIKTYCYYGDLAKVHQETRGKLTELFQKSMKDGPQSVRVLEDLTRNWNRDVAEQSANIGECNEQQQKIAIALKARKSPGNPTCDTAAAK